MHRRKKRRFEVLQKGISPSPVSFWPTSSHFATRSQKAPVCLLLRRGRTGFGILVPSRGRRGLEVREIIEVRFIKLEEKILSSQTQGGAPANTQTRGADPFWTPSAAAAATAPASVSARAPAPTPASTEAPASVSTRGLAPSRSAASAPYRNRASATAHTGGPANAAKTRSQTK
ncbi:hypothetical protein HID58_022415, partial [Brassica napus]